jgi:hypothetical protein
VIAPFLTANDRIDRPVPTGTVTFLFLSCQLGK